MRTCLRPRTRQFREHQWIHGAVRHTSMFKLLPGWRQRARRDQQRLPKWQDQASQLNHLPWRSLHRGPEWRRGTTRSRSKRDSSALTTLPRPRQQRGREPEHHRSQSMADARILRQVRASIPQTLVERAIHRADIRGRPSKAIIGPHLPKPGHKAAGRFQKQTLMQKSGRLGGHPNGRLHPRLHPSPARRTSRGLHIPRPNEGSR